MNIKELIKNGTEILKKYNIDEAYLKAKILLEYELGVKNEYLIIHYEDEVEIKNLEKYKLDLQKLVNGFPIQYITNNQEFFGLNFYVDENVLIPQPDTELLIEEVINIAKKMEKPKILDMCTGSGAIAISIAKNINAEIYASDISKKALNISKVNAKKNNIDIKFIESNMFSKIDKKFDIIVSNPPYIETNTIQLLSDEVKNEPKIALDGGEDGLNFYRILAKECKKYLNNSGILAVEIGYNQKEKVLKIFQENGLKDLYSKKDYGNNDRIIIGRI